MMEIPMPKEVCEDFDLAGSYMRVPCSKCGHVHPSRFKDSIADDMLYSSSDLSLHPIALQSYRPVLTVDAIVFKDEKYLLIKRKNPPHGWALPGGLVDWGETVDVAVKRELMEETNLKATKISFFTIASKPTRDPRFHAVSIVYEINKYLNEPKAADDAIEFGWFTLEDLADVQVAFDHMDLLRCHKMKMILGV
jgi:ADP-ribose pyrophosphatase YjhB (NUDIX family)